MSKNLFILLILSIILSGCTGDTCIDADDFGFQKFTVSARYKKDEIQELQPGNQIVPWRDSGLRTNGEPLTMVIKTWDYLSGDKNKAQELSAWCPWYGYDDNVATLSSFCERLQDCTFYGDMCTSTKSSQIKNAPCIFRNGIGLYALIAEPGSDPNALLSSETSPSGITFHLGVPTDGYQLYDINKHGIQQRAGGIRFLYSDIGLDPVTYHDSQLFFKILDKFYDDNSGQYRVVIKSGVNDDRPDPLEFLTKLVMKQLFGQEIGMQDKFNADGDNYGLVKTIFNNLIKTPAYRISVSAVLTLYIMFTAFSFLTGNLNITHTEIIIRVIKIAMVSALLTTESAWSFFYDYLFVYFVGGVMEVKNLIMQAGATGPGSASILGLMIAPQTMAKLFSLLFVDWFGIIYIILFLIALYFILMMLLEATVIYLTALIAIGMIITMGPIFICFLLFDITKSLFENWLKQLISYAFQPIILFAGIALISILIRSEIYASLGFRVCKHDFPDLGPISDIFGTFTDDLDLSLGNLIFYWWFPEEITHTSDPRDLVDIPIPEGFIKADNTECKPYGCIGKRFIELPFLDPKIPSDKDRISRFASGKFVQLDGLLLIFIYVYLISKFNALSISVSRFISGTQNNFTDLNDIGQQAFAPIKQQIDRPIEAAYDQTTKTLRKGFRAVADKLQEKASMVYGALYAISHPGETYAEIMKGRLMHEALDPKRANSSVLAEVKRSYGMDIKDVKAGAAEGYTAALKAKLEQLNPNLKGGELDGYAAKMSNKDYKDLKDDFAEAKFGKGKKYSSLGDAQRKDIDNVMNDRKLELRELSSDAKFNRDFQSAYINAHQDMSYRGIGLFGKNIAGLRSLEELKHRVDSKEELKKAKRRNLGERIYAGYEGIKRKAITGITGEALRDSFEGSLTGAAWHDFNYNDPQLKTYNESLKDDQRNQEYQELQSKINRETINTQEDVLKPEYLARLASQGMDGNLRYYEELSNQKLAHEVRRALSAGEDPAIMGDRFMSEKATDSQLRGVIDKINNSREDFIENDIYIRREEHYDIMQEKAIENIQNAYDLLKEHYQPAS